MLQAAQVVALMPRVLTSQVASRVPAIAAMRETVKRAQVFRCSLYNVLMSVNLLRAGHTQPAKFCSGDANSFVRVPQKWRFEITLLRLKWF